MNPLLWGQIMAAALFVVPTVTLRLLFVLVILAHDRRRITHVAVTDRPHGSQITWQKSRLSAHSRQRALAPVVAQTKFALSSRLPAPLKRA
jgi:hypothetical protein